MMAGCFIIMPITTPADFVRRYNDEEHFQHVLDLLFEPAVQEAGFEPLSPVASGADLIHAEIVRQLELSELVLCDISTLNPNVFFELGIRTAVDKPVALVRDHFTRDIPFDTSIVNFHTYDGSLSAWLLDEEVRKLAAHLKASSERSEGRNPLWRSFGLTTQAAFRLGESLLEQKVDLLLRMLQEKPLTTAEPARTSPQAPYAAVSFKGEPLPPLQGMDISELREFASQRGIKSSERTREGLIAAIVEDAARRAGMEQ